MSEHTPASHAQLRLPVAKILPADARAMLTRAARVDSNTPWSDSPTRTQFLNDATRRVKAMYPEFFRKET